MNPFPVVTVFESPIGLSELAIFQEYNEERNVFHCTHCSNSGFINWMFNCWVDFTKLLYLGVLFFDIGLSTGCDIILVMPLSFKFVQGTEFPLSSLSIHMNRKDSNLYRATQHHVDESVHYKWKNTVIMNRPVRKVGRKKTCQNSQA